MSLKFVIAGGSYFAVVIALGYYFVVPNAVQSQPGYVEPRSQSEWGGDSYMRNSINPNETNYPWVYRDYGYDSRPFSAVQVKPVRHVSRPARRARGCKLYVSKNKS